MLYRQAIIKYSEKYGVTKAAISVYRWIKRYEFEDFAKQLAVHNRRSNNFPMRPLNWNSPFDFTAQYVLYKKRQPV